MNTNPGEPQGPTNVIAIDGKGRTGKGELVKRLVKWTGLPVLNSGAIYRTFYAMATRQGIDVADTVAVNEFLAWNKYRVTVSDGKVMLDGSVLPDEELRSHRANLLTPVLAQNRCLRSMILSLQHAQVGPKGLIAEGRDMGTVVFPAARVKVFLTATTEVRAEREFRTQKEKSLAQVTEALVERDRKDEERAHSPLLPAPDAVEIDTSDMTKLEVAVQVMRLWDRGFALSEVEVATEAELDAAPA